MCELREDLLNLVPNNIINMDNEEFIDFISDKFNLNKRSIRLILENIPKEYVYLCKLYKIRSSYIQDVVIYNGNLVTQKYLAEKFNINELTIGRYRNKINNDDEFIKLLESGELLEEELSNRRRNSVNSRYLKESKPKLNETFNFGFGIKETIDEFIKNLNLTARREKVRSDIIKYGADRVYIHYTTGVKYSDIDEHVYMDNGIPYSLRQICIKYNKSYDTMKKLRWKTGLSRDEFLEFLINYNSNNSSEPVQVVVDNIIYRFDSQTKLSEFINMPRSFINSVIRNKRNIDKVLESCHIKERLLFKDNSPYSTWFADNTWIYKCPTCKRKLLMSTEELINYKHDDMLCKEYEVEDVINE